LLRVWAASANRDAANADYAAKRPALAQSAYALTRKLADDHADWTPEQVAARQNWMANQATAIWRVAQLA
jgi:hypothetical protein